MTRNAAVSVTPRDRALLRAAWSLGWAPSTTLTTLCAPGTTVKTLARRLSELARAGLLRRRRFTGGPAGHVWLYGAGPAAARVDPGYRDAWRPPDLHLDHTLATADTLTALLHPGRLGRLTPTGWTGQAELRTWHQPGQAMPDLRLTWTGSAPSDSDDATGGSAGMGAWDVEVDRGTESRHALRTKLLRYLHTPGRQVLVVTTSDARARNIARLARDLGADTLTTTQHALHDRGVPDVYDAVRSVRRPLDQPPA